MYDVCGVELNKEELSDYIATTIENSDKPFLVHYGTPRHSGRYPWGSGDNPYQHNEKFIRYVNEQKKKGVKERDIADSLGFNSTIELRARYQAATNNNRKDDVAYALKLKNKGWSNRAIGEKMGINESSVRSLLDPSKHNGAEEMDRTIAELKEGVAKTGYLDVGSDSEHYFNNKGGISKDKLEKALVLIQDEGYVVDNIHVKQASGKGYTDVRVLAKEGSTKKDIYNNMGKISTMADVNPDLDALSKTKLGIYKPESISSKRVAVVYDEDGGSLRDGLIELRRGVDDISLGNSRYAQVRIAVDGTHYLKGMAVYSDDLPPGIDVRFHTNKSKDTPMMGPKNDTVLKPLKTKADGSIDWDNPFGSSIMKDGQRMYTDKNGEEKLSAINKVNEEGSWVDWASSNSLASQMLGKQPVSLAKRQLKQAYANKQDEFNEIMSNTNPTVKRHLLLEFADECDSAAVDLKAAGLPRQAAKVILPIPSLKDNEIYAPTFRDGETVVLIRYPHAGRFEMPELTVNNRNKEGIKTIPKDAIDAVGINKTVADQLSGADFDGDSVIVIPNNDHAIKADDPLFKNFETTRAYPAVPGMKKLTENNKQLEMGKISNLITDMTIQNAPKEELARAVKHSMVIIDAEKHELNYTKSFTDQGIAELQKKYQPKPDGKSGGGAYTLLSRASSPVYIDKRQGTYRIDPETGKKIWKTSPETWTDKKGDVHTYKQEVKLMSVTDDAFDLSTGTQIENVYANYANSVKSLGNQARKASLGLKLNYNPEAAKTYSKEVEDLDRQLKVAKMNAPKERQAQILATVIADEKIASESTNDKDRIKKIRNQAIIAARAQVGASKTKIEITPQHWKAIQAGAVSDTKLSQILRNTDDELIKKYSMPKSNKSFNQSQINLAKSLKNQGFTLSEIADRMGVSTSTISNLINDK